MSHRERRTLSATVLSLLLLAALGLAIQFALGAAAPQKAAAQEETSTHVYPTDTEDALGGLDLATVRVKPMPESYYCGPEALRAVLRKWGDAASLDELAARAGTTAADGTSLAGLRDAAQTRGATAMGVQLDYIALQDQVGQSGMAVIVHVTPDHYYWVRYANADGVAVQDQSSPASRWMPRAEFEGMWSGKALLVLRPARSLAHTRTPAR